MICGTGKERSTQAYFMGTNSGEKINEKIIEKTTADLKLNY